jgi:hypothetical protein
MKISELIATLEGLRAIHGDVSCVTPGFDEAGIEDIGIVHAIRVRRDGDRQNARRVRVRRDSDIAVEINFA